MNHLQIMYQKVSKEIISIIVITTLLTVLSSVMQSSYAQSNTDLENDMLNIHNEERDAVSVPPLTWNSSLESRRPKLGESFDDARAYM